MKKRLTLQTLLGRSCAFACLTLGSSAMAAGFQIQEQSVVNLGLAYAGTAALADDASTAFYNPAGLTRISEKALSVSAVALSSRAAITPTVARNQAATSTSLERANGGGVSPMAGLFYAARITDNMIFGLSVTSPFGLKTDYGVTSSVRYQATKSELITLDFGPSIAYKYNDWSMAVGFDAVHGEAKLYSAINTQTTAANVVPGFDIMSQSQFKDWAWGYHAGLMYEPSHSTRVGLNFRSKLDFKGLGDSRTITGTSTTVSRIKANITLPETLTLSMFQELNHKWDVVGDVSWTQWNRFKKLVITNVLTNGTTTVDENFRDAFRVAFGAIHHCNKSWDLKAGVAFDQTPTRDANRTARIPDEDRYWFALGARYEVSKAAKIDLGYSYLSFKRASIDESAPTSASAAGVVSPNFARLTGRYKSYANILGVQVNWTF